MGDIISGEERQHLYFCNFPYHLFSANNTGASVIQTTAYLFDATTIVSMYSNNKRVFEMF